LSNGGDKKVYTDYIRAVYGAIEAMKLIRMFAEKLFY
jgi:hypothetical protein